MNGLPLSGRYYRQHGVPMLREKYAADLDRIAVGLVGDGSDCLGFDDGQSRDHDWGPGFCLWLTGADYDRIGPPLQRDYLTLPAAFEGFERQAGEWGIGRVGVFEIGAFYKGFIGRPDLPETLADWFRIPEKNLAAATSGQVFEDPLGEFSRIRQGLLGFYPDDVRIAKIAARCMTAGQAGQYNFPRSIRRGELFAAQYAETKFCADIMSLVYLVNRRYAPYYKWLQRGLAGLSRLGDRLSGDMSALMAARSPGAKSAGIEAICATVIAELRREGLSDSGSPFLLDHGPLVHDRIIDPALRAVDVWVGP